MVQMVFALQAGLPQNLVCHADPHTHAYSLNAISNYIYKLVRGHDVVIKCNQNLT